MRGAGTCAQCHLAVPLLDMRIRCGADPLVRGRRPRRPFTVHALDPIGAERVRGTRADQGVRPTIKPEFATPRKLSDIGHECLPCRNSSRHVGAVTYSSRTSIGTSARATSSRPSRRRRRGLLGTGEECRWDAQVVADAFVPNQILDTDGFRVEIGQRRHFVDGKGEHDSIHATIFFEAVTVRW